MLELGTFLSLASKLMSWANTWHILTLSDTQKFSDPPGKSWAAQCHPRPHPTGQWGCLREKCFQPLPTSSNYLGILGDLRGPEWCPQSFVSQALVCQTRGHPHHQHKSGKSGKKWKCQNKNSCAESNSFDLTSNFFRTRIWTVIPLKSRPQCTEPTDCKGSSLHRGHGSLPVFGTYGYYLLGIYGYGILSAVYWYRRDSDAAFLA